MDFEQIMNQLQEFLPAENFKLQPQSSHRELIDLEKKYNINTSDLIEKKVDFRKITSADLDHWVNNYETFLAFNGRIETLNTVFPSLNRKTMENYIANPTKQNIDDYTNKQEVNPIGFTSCFI